MPPSVRRRPNDRSSGPLSPPALAKSAGFRSTLESGIRSAVIIPMRQQPGPMLIFRLTEDRRSRLDVGRHGGNPHSVPGAPVIPLRRHHEQLKNTCAVVAPTVGAGDLSYPAAAAAVVVVAGRGCRLVVTEYVWEAADTIPACWPQHPHLVHEIAVLPDQRRRAGHAFTNDALEEWPRYSLPALTERMTSRLRSHCEDGHQAWPAKGRYTRHTAEASHRSREDVAALKPTEERGRRRPQLGLVDLDTGEIKNI